MRVYLDDDGDNIVYEHTYPFGVAYHIGVPLYTFKDRGRDAVEEMMMAALCRLERTFPLNDVETSIQTGTFKVN